MVVENCTFCDTLIPVLAASRRRNGCTIVGVQANGVACLQHETRPQDAKHVGLCRKHHESTKAATQVLLGLAALRDTVQPAAQKVIRELQEAAAAFAGAEGPEACFKIGGVLMHI